MIVDRRPCRMRAASSMHPNKMYGDSGADTSSGLHQLRYGEKKFTPTNSTLGGILWGLLFLVGWQEKQVGYQFLECGYHFRFLARLYKFLITSVFYTDLSDLLRMRLLDFQVRRHRRGQILRGTGDLLL